MISVNSRKLTKIIFITTSFSLRYFGFSFLVFKIDKISLKLCNLLGLAMRKRNGKMMRKSMIFRFWWYYWFVDGATRLTVFIMHFLSSLTSHTTKSGNRWISDDSFWDILRVDGRSSIFVAACSAWRLKRYIKI